MSKHWTLDDIDWQAFEPAKVDSALLAIIKTAAIVEANAADYVTYLLNVFEGDEAFCAVVHQWGEEEKQHGAALARWAELADSDFSFDESFKRVTEDGYQLPLEVTESVRGSRQGELLSRCLVESSTTSFYTAITDAAEEPVLRDIAKRIAADETRHYGLFRRHLERYEADEEKLSILKRIRVVLGRIGEADDDEFAFAYYATNIAGRQDVSYDQEECAAAYHRHALGLYARNHLELGGKMILRAFGLKPDRVLAKTLLPVMWLAFRRHRSQFDKAA